MKVGVLHIVRTVGEPNQPYMTRLFKAFMNSQNFNHTIYTDIIKSKEGLQNIIKRKNIYFSLLWVRLLFFDNDFSVLFKDKSYKHRIKFLIKWSHLILFDTRLIHVHNLQVLDSDILRFLKQKNKILICSLRGRDLLVNLQDVEHRKQFFKKMQSFDYLHVISQYMYQEVEDIALKIPIKVIYRGAECLENQNKKQHFYVSEIAKKEIKILVVGRLVWEKGHYLLLDAIYRLKRRGYMINLDIYGEGGYEEFLKFRTHQLELSNEVNFCGYVQNDTLRTKYKQYDLAVQPSLSEALSNGLLEMVLHNLPVVISNVGGMVEIIEDGVNGIHFDIKSPDTMDRAILESLTLDIERLKQHNLKIQECFSSSNELFQLQKLYTHLIQKNNSLEI